MKAVFIERTGGPEVLQYGEQTAPVAKPGEVIVDIVAASVNAADWKVRTGAGAPIAAFPYILGRDFAGRVSALGEGVSDLKIGDEVFAVCAVGKDGAYAEKIAIEAALLGKRPPNLSHADAAAMALTGLTAISAIEESIKLKRGETILIQGGAGGVAGFGIQFAKHIGAKVITTASPANHAYVRGLGADEVIDYHSVDFTKVVSGVDAVFETVGGDVTERSFSVIRPGGRLSSIGGGQPPPVSPRSDVQGLRPPVGRSRAGMERIADLFVRGIVRPPEVKMYALSEARAAHEVSEGRHFRGKLVLKVR